MSNASSQNEIDFKWFEAHLLNDILPKWQRASTDEGLFMCHFDRQWQPLQKGFGTLVSQSRLLYNYSKGYELTGDTWYLNAIESGARFLIDKFWDHDHGGWAWSCSQEGEVLDWCKDSYGHAFVIFGLSHACQTTGNQDFKTAALDTWQVFTKHFRDEHGGFSFRMSRDFQETEPLKSQNPIMHLFEALLAVGDLPDMAEMHQEAEQVAEFILKRLLRSDEKMLPEVYSPDWQELPASQEGRIDIGHAFEWAYLLSTAVERGLPATYFTQAENFLAYGLRIGYDTDAGGIFSPASPQGEIQSAKKGWWEQCETIRSLMHFAIIHGRDDLWQPLEQTIGFIKSDFVDPEYGGWYTSREPGVNPFDQSKGNEWKLDYHVVGMCMEAIRHRR